MGTAGNPGVVKLFLGIMYTNDTVKEDALAQCTARFGDIEYAYGPLAVSRFTDYYTAEMGATIQKRYFVFTPLIKREELTLIKTFTNTVEQHFLINNRRQINLDPGYIARDKLVLATTKDFYHRIYISEGIYGEVTLHYRKGRFRYFSWTYPDYKEKGVQELLEKARARLVWELKKRARC